MLCWLTCALYAAPCVRKMAVEVNEEPSQTSAQHPGAQVPLPTNSRQRRFPSEHPFLWYHAQHRPPITFRKP
jgi:hypothetical protein